MQACSVALDHEKVAGLGHQGLNPRHCADAELAAVAETIHQFCIGHLSVTQKCIKKGLAKRLWWTCNLKAMQQDTTYLGTRGTLGSLP